MNVSDGPISIYVARDIFDALDDRLDPDMPTHGEVVAGLLQTVDTVLPMLADARIEIADLKRQLALSHEVNVKYDETVSKALQQRDEAQAAVKMLSDTCERWHAAREKAEAELKATEEQRGDWEDRAVGAEERLKEAEAEAAALRDALQKIANGAEDGGWPWCEDEAKKALSQPGPGAALLRIVAQARTVAKHWRDQDGVNAAEIDALCDAVEKP